MRRVKRKGAALLPLESDAVRERRFLSGSYCRRWGNDERKVLEQYNADARAVARLHGFDME